MPATSATIFCTVLAVFAFAANSVLCRLALGRGAIDAASFTAIRLGAGAAALLAIHWCRRTASQRALKRDWTSTVALFLYATAFSMAYRELAAGTGALLLFGSVQLTMLGAGLAQGERPRFTTWLGLMAAFGGIGYLVSPGVSAPPVVGSALMVLAGAAWGIYSLRGRRGGDPLATNAANFLWAVPLGLVLWATRLGTESVTGIGVTWAVLSGAVASGLGYAIWYYALPALTATRAATVQLTVPVIAALGGVAFLAEAVTLRLILASLLVLGGVGLAILDRSRSSKGSGR